MRKLLLLILCLFTGCQTMEIGYEGATKEFEFSNVEKQSGKKYEGESYSWYFLEIETYSASMDRSTKTMPGYTMKNVSVTTSYGPVTSAWRVLQVAFIGLPILSHRSLLVKGIVTKEK